MALSEKGLHFTPVLHPKAQAPYDIIVTRDHNLTQPISFEFWQLSRQLTNNADMFKTILAFWLVLMQLLIRHQFVSKSL